MQKASQAWGSVSSHTPSYHLLSPYRSLTIRPALELQVWIGRGWNWEVSLVHRVLWGRECITGHLLMARLFLILLPGAGLPR